MDRWQLLAVRQSNVFEVDPIEIGDWVKLHVIRQCKGTHNEEIARLRIVIAVLTMYHIIAVAHLLYSTIPGNLYTLFGTLGISPEITLLTTSVCYRHKFHLLKSDCRSHRIGNKLDSNRHHVQYMCRHSHTPHIQATHTCTDHA